MHENGHHTSYKDLKRKFKLDRDFLHVYLSIIYGGSLFTIHGQFLLDFMCLRG